jgi:Uncharacterized protein conserved in bacteria (DUF2219)
MRSGFGILFGAALAVMACAAQAEEAALPADQPVRQTIGWGRMFTNDVIGDFYDRWRSSSYTVSRVRGPEWTGDLPTAFGRVLEFRVRADHITPSTLDAPAAKDRRYAGMLSFGYHSHSSWRGNDLSLGADVVLIGPQTGLSQLQDVLHDRLGLKDGAAAYNAQFGNALLFSGTGEVGRNLQISPSVALRPFVEGQVGVENLARAGADVTLGNLGKGGLMLREATTGQRYSAIQGAAGKGLSLTVGGDIAAVASSYLLPAGGAVTASKTRTRLRAGLNWQGEKSFVFFGLTHLSKEFDEQPEGQTVGSLSLLVRF